MDLSQLPRLGKVAGVPGIALGAVVLMASAALAESGQVPDAWKGPLLLVAVLGAVILGIATVIAWSLAHRPGAQIARTEGDNSAATVRDASKSAVRGAQLASTKGRDSPAVVERR